MEVQSPFQIVWEKTDRDTKFPEFLLQRIVKYGSNLAMVDTETGKQWRYNDLRHWTDNCVQRLREIGVTPTSRVSIVSANCPEVLIVHFACGIIGSACACLDSVATIDELWHQVDLAEATHCITQPQLQAKVEEVKKKAIMRGGGRIRTVKLLSEVVSDTPLCPPTSVREQSILRQKLELKSRSSMPDILKSKQYSPMNGTKLPIDQRMGSTSVSEEGLLDQEAPPYISPAASDATYIKTNHALSTTSIPSSDKTTTPVKDEPSIEEKGGQRLRRESKQLGSRDLTTAAGRQLENGSAFNYNYLIFFSSGTTGLPKPVEVSHKSLLVNLQQISMAHFGPPAIKDRMLQTLVLHHMYGTLVAYYCLYNGSTLFTMPKYSAETMLQAIHQLKITHIHLVPHMVSALANALVDNSTLSSLKSLTCSAAPLDISIAELCKERLTLTDFRQLYGMLELSGVSTWSHSACSKIGSVGVPLPGMLFKVVNTETRQLCWPMEVGELRIKGPQILLQYYKNPKATAEMIDSAGFIRTGDAAYYDEEGYFYIVDRIKDIIKYKGTQVSPSEVESVLRLHPGVDDCAVVGRPDHVAGEVPAAFVVRNVAHPLLASAEIRQYVAGRISTFKELRGGVFFISEIPRSTTGKVLRRQLKQYWDRERGAQAVKEANARAIARSTTGKVLRRQLKQYWDRERGAQAVKEANARAIARKQQTIQALASNGTEKGRTAKTVQSVSSASGKESKTKATAPPARKTTTRLDARSLQTGRPAARGGPSKKL
uniref:Uncharacterized protein n=1 Tax=Plectus sambesii TaxID=2011161 RepID=A0A914XED9_9BILA